VAAAEVVVRPLAAGPGAPCDVTVDVDGPPPPVDFGFDVTLRLPGHGAGWAVGKLEGRRGWACRRVFTLSLTIPAGAVSDLTAADLIFEPNRLAAGHPPPPAVWGEQVIVKDVKVRRLRPPPPSPTPEPAFGE
jgi:hypothetical protein